MYYCVIENFFKQESIGWRLIDSCQHRVIDTIEVINEVQNLIDLGRDTTVCESEIELSLIHI